MIIDIGQSYDILDQYIYIELYNGKNIYDKKPYMYDYGLGPKKYRNIFVKIINKNFLIKNRPQEIFFVCAKEIYDKNEIKRLAKYCTCNRCNSKWYHFNKLFTFFDSSTISCLKDSDAIQDPGNVARARFTEKYKTSLSNKN